MNALAAQRRNHKSPETTTYLERINEVGAMAIAGGTADRWLQRQASSNRNSECRYYYPVTASVADDPGIGHKCTPLDRSS